MRMKREKGKYDDDGMEYGSNSPILDKKNRGGMKYLSNKETQKRKPK
jgi:hypothetical protein